MQDLFLIFWFRCKLSWRKKLKKSREVKDLEQNEQKKKDKINVKNDFFAALLVKSTAGS